MRLRLSVITLMLTACIAFQAAAQLNITSFTPTRFAGNVPVNANISVTFNLNIDGATLNSSTFIVRGSLTGVIAGTLTGAGANTVTFNPTEDFKLGENVSFTITNAIRSTLAVAPTRGYTYSFDVIAGATTVAPQNFALRLISYGGGLLPNDIKAMDINNDGHMDFVTANQGSGSDNTHAWTSDGNGDWCRVEFGKNRNAEMFDLDGDGDKDGLNVLPNVFGFSWSRNDAGVFTTIDLSANRIAFNGFCYGSDIDNDGDIDLIGFNGSVLNPPTGVVIHRNNGTGTFAGLTGLFNPGNIHSDSHMRIADINGDGALDFVLYDLNAGRIDWWENNGLSTSFTQHLVGNLTAGRRIFLTIANIDDDGDLDILAGDRNNPAGLVLFTNDGTQTFTQQDLPVMTSSSINNVRVGDVDGDLDKDIIMASQWLENNGSEVFTAYKIGGRNYGVSADFVDMDGDGDMDILTHDNSLQRGIYWLENTLGMNVTSVTPANAGRSVAANSNITVTFDQPINPSTVNSNTLTVTSSLRGIVPGTYNVSANTVTFTPTGGFKPGDEIQVAVTNKIVSNGNHKVVQNYGFDFTIAVTPTGPPTFGTTNPVVMTYATAPVAMDLGDMDNDGDIDIVSCSASQLNWHRNDGAGAFTSIPITVTGTLTGMSIIDFNRDGLLDIIVNPTGRALVFINDASQNFAPITIGFTSSPMNKIGDVDRNGTEDLHMGNFAHFSCNNFTSGTFSAASTMSALDFDSDGDIDALRAGNVGDFNRNEGGMYFTATTIVNASSLGSASADFDNDGDYDVAIATGSLASWYTNNLNTASNNFSTGVALTAIRASRAMAATDLDGDGDIDLAGSGVAAGAVVLRNRINESLAFPIVQTLIPTTSSPWFIKAGDINGDGKMDFVVMSVAPGNDIRWFNNTSVSLSGPNITSFNPTSGEVSTTVTISGSNFSATAANNTVMFNGTPAVVSAATTTSITVQVPNGATTGKITVTVAGQTATSLTDFTVTTPTPTPPTITSFTPASGPTGTTVIINGTNFSTTAANNTVTFNGTTATVTASTSTSITAIVPANATTGKISVTVAGTTASSATDFNVTVPVGNAPVINTASTTTTAGGVASINLLPLLTDADNNLDLATLKILVQPTSGAPATIDANHNLKVDYKDHPFTGTDQITIEVCDLTANCTQEVLTVEVNEEEVTDDDIAIYNAISPNGDGKNDVFYIEYIDSRPDTQNNKVTIYNRWGDLVFEVSNYDNTSRVFKGENNNKNELPSGIYYYKIKFSSNRPAESGYLVLKR